MVQVHYQVKLFLGQQFLQVVFPKAGRFTFAELQPLRRGDILSALGAQAMCSHQ
jgi:hypothetical protein